MFFDGGLVDVFCMVYFDLVVNFGFMWLFDNLLFLMLFLIWVFEVDECDCIDYIFVIFDV